MTAIRGSLKPSPADIIPPGTNKQERSLTENGTIIQDTVAWTTFRFPTKRERKLIDNDNLFPELIGPIFYSFNYCFIISIGSDFYA